MRSTCFQSKILALLNLKLNYDEIVECSISVSQLQEPLLPYKFPLRLRDYDNHDKVEALHKIDMPPLRPGFVTGSPEPLDTTPPIAGLI